VGPHAHDIVTGTQYNLNPSNVNPSPARPSRTRILALGPLRPQPRTSRHPIITPSEYDAPSRCAASLLVRQLRRARLLRLDELLMHCSQLRERLLVYLRLLAEQRLALLLEALHVPRPHPFARAVGCGSELETALPV